jgi:outer membrane protein TolC
VLKITAALMLALGAELTATRAHALQGLDEFVAASKNNPSRKEADATAKQREAEADQTVARLLPTLTAKATYTRNQYDATTANGTITITPKDQLDGLFSLNVPLVDVGSWMRIGGANAASDASRARLDGTVASIEKDVTRAFYQVVASEATVQSALKALAVNEENKVLVVRRKEAGSASDLDVERAKAQIERSKQVLATAEQQRNVARRQLETASGLKPTDGASALPSDDLHAAPAFDASAVARLPDARAADLDVKAADKNETAAWAALAPTLNAQASERITNATGFSGHETSWAIGLTLQIVLDPQAVYVAKAQAAAKVAASARAERTKAQLGDQVFQEVEEIRAQIAKYKAASAELEASDKAAKLARERYQSGAATQLEVMQADKDAFAADVARIQSLADLAFARASHAIDMKSGKGEGAR